MDQFRDEAAAADLAGQDRRQPSAWPALDWWHIETNEHQSRKMTFVEFSNLQAAADIPYHPPSKSKQLGLGFAVELCIKLVNVNKQEIELSLW